jgi:hypothetical protein
LSWFILGLTLSRAVRRRKRVFRFLDLPRKVLNLESNQFDRRQEFRWVQVISMELALKRTQASDVLLQPLSWSGHGSILTDTRLTSVRLNLRVWSSIHKAHRCVSGATQRACIRDGPDRVHIRVLLQPSVSSCSLSPCLTSECGMQPKCHSRSIAWHSDLAARSYCAV